MSPAKLINHTVEYLKSGVVNIKTISDSCQ